MRPLMISFALILFFIGVKDILAQATVEGKLILPEPAQGRDYWVIVDEDGDGGNGYAKIVEGICGSDTVINYTLSNVPIGTYYIYGCVRIVSYHGTPPEIGDYLGVYGGTIDEYPSEPNAFVPASGTVSFDIIMSKWTWDEMFVSHTITEDLNGANAVFVVDIDNDEDLDVVSTASDIFSNLGEIAWWENDGLQKYQKHTIDDQIEGPRSIYPADLDDDGDIDIAAVAFWGGEIAWWENEGSQNFSKHNLENWSYANSVYVADLDQDNDMDILGTSWGTDEIAWWENKGSHTFTKHFVDNYFRGACDVCAIDIDGDGDLDVVSSGNVANQIAWWENDGSENFTKHIVGDNFFDIVSVYTTDMENDGDIDIICADRYGDEVSWWENDGTLNFTKYVVDDDIGWPECVFAADIDQDGDMDILYAANIDGIIGWYENLSENNFKNRILNGNLYGASSVYAADIDRDGDLDVIGASDHSNTIMWWENTLIQVSPVETEEQIVIDKFLLFQNYPNPFNPGTIISYQLPTISKVDLSIYNLLGQMIVTLVSQEQPAGYYNVEWDASGYASGVYLCRLKTNKGFIQTRKLILLK